MLQNTPKFRTKIADDASEFRAAQELRYRVFIQELGGGGDMVDHELGLERDRFDPYFDHILLFDDARITNPIIGVYRVMSCEKANEVGDMRVIGDVKGKTCILVDDIIDSGGTIVNAAKALKNRGAKDVFVYITHGVLSGDAVKKIKNSVIKNLVITDTIDNFERTKNVKNIEVLPISGLMGEAIKRISNSTSVSDLFK